MDNLSGISEANRRRLTQLHRQTKGLVDAKDAAEILGLTRQQASKLLAQWATQGWTRRLRRGLYLLVPLEATSPGDWSEDAWIVASRVFHPGYIAGWSACEFWDLTEQIFRDVAVFTAAPIHERRMVIDRAVFVLRKIPERLLFGRRTVWRKDTRIQVSDPTRTLVDILDNPWWGGGIRHVSQILTAYLASEHRDEDLLLEYLGRLGNAAASKRLGYLVEARARGAQALVEQLQLRLTSGYALLDPSAPARGRHVDRWKVRVNVGMGIPA